MNDRTARATAEQAARASYGRLVALLASRFNDIAAAEDALGDAFLHALRTWPVDGVPANPDAWLFTVARNRLSSAFRHRRVVEAAVPDLLVLGDAYAGDPEGIPDYRLRLLFVCAHPALDAGVRTPLMLQVVLGLPTARMAAAFVVSPAAMAQRLVRAKAKIRDARIRFELPERCDMPQRLDDVLEAIYAAYGICWDAVDGGDDTGGHLVDEALHLCRLLVAAMPEEPEPRGLLALILYCEARRRARRNERGEFLPLSEQDTQLWDHAMIGEAERQLALAAGRGRFGRFQCEAAIQSVHAERAVSGRVDTAGLLTLYALLDRNAPSIGTRVGYAAAMLQSGDPRRALALLDALDESSVGAYQPWWATRAHVLAALGDAERAQRAMEQAIGLAVDPAVRAHLSRVLRERIVTARASGPLPHT